jgi:hypothetical protein
MVPGIWIIEKPIPNNTYEITLIATDAEIRNLEAHNMELVLRCYY